MSVIFEQTAVLMIFAFAGWLICHLGKAKEEHSGLLSALEFYVFCPCVTFNSFATNFRSEIITEKLPLVLASCIITVVMAVAGHVISARLSKEPIERGVYSYSITMPNYGYVGYALALSLFGSMGQMDFIIFCLPLAIYVYTDGYRMLTGSTQMTLKKLINPANIAMVLGMVAGLIELPVPALVTNVLTGAGACMAPISMLLLGMVLSAFPLKELLKEKKAYFVTLLRLIVIPLLTWLIAKPFCSPDLLRILTLFSVLPCGMNSIIFPKLVGGNCRPGAALALISNIACLATIPVMLTLLL